MADDDEIDVMGDFSFNSCFAQNNQGIPSCSNREDTVHPQWLLDSTETNWYDTKSKVKDGTPRTLYGYNSANIFMESHTAWSKDERDLLLTEMAKYGRNVRKISQTLKTKTEAEIQALIEAEFGVNLDTPSFGLEKDEENEGIPVVQEEIVTDEINMNNILEIVTTGTPTIKLPKAPSRKKNTNTKSLLKPGIFNKEPDIIANNPSEIFYEDDLIIGSTESIGSELDLTDIVSKKIAQQQVRAKAEKKIGNHRRKLSRNYDKSKRNGSKEVMKSPQGRQRKDSGLSDESTKSPKMQIVLGSGQALPVSEGEQVIKIEKKKDSEPESDIEIDVDSDNEDNKMKSPMKDVKESPKDSVEAPIAVPLRKFEPMPKRQKKINLDGGGGYTIMHTEAGDLYEVAPEPRKERQPRKQPIPLIHCQLYSAEHPAPYEVRLNVSTLILMDAHAHTSRGEVMGLLGGALSGAHGAGGGALHMWAYEPVAAAAGGTHCDMDPVSQSVAAEALRSRAALCGWHHSHPEFPPAPSRLDLRSARGLQRALAPAPAVALITSPHWPARRTATQYRCIRVEDSEDPENPTGFRFSVRLVADVTAASVPVFLAELRALLWSQAGADALSLDMAADICPQARRTYLEKLISSVSHHMRSAGYPDDDSVVKQLLEGIRDVFR